jgi:putative membrane protein
MKKLHHLLLSGALATICFSCNNSATSTAAQDSARVDSARADSTARATAVTVSKVDQDFAISTADAGMTEIQAAGIAEKKSTNKEVTDYAKMMVTDHTAAADKLKDIAAKKNITLPTTVSADMQKNLDDLQSKSGKTFDKDYIKMMVDDHKKVIKSFEDESKNGQDADIRAFADSTLHTLQHHLDEAEKCSKMMGKM